MKKILVVDDDPHIGEVISFSLEKAGYSHKIAMDGKSAVDIFVMWQPDLIILDVGLPEMDGLEVCRQIRKTSEVPILFLSAQTDEIDRVLGLEIGGDDYVTKPFSPRELMARVSAVLKRTSPARTEDKGGKVLQHGELVLDPVRHAVSFKGKEISLTALEFNIVRILLGQPRMVFTREKILDAAYPDNIHVSDRTIDSHIRNIRSKVAAAGCEDVIETVHGVGFRLGGCGTS